MGKSSWLFKKRDEKNSHGRTCNVVDIKGINYKDFVREFGQSTDKSKNNISGTTHRWLFETPNGEKFDVYYDTSDYVINKIRRENLKSHGPVDIEDIDELTIQGSLEQITMLRTYLHFLFGVDEIDSWDRKRTFEYLFKRWDDR